MPETLKNLPQICCSVWSESSKLQQGFISEAAFGSILIVAFVLEAFFAELELEESEESRAQ
ncbi:hypothetical protein Ancab_011480, partial [Ancistrocladus abbreviatus]